MKKLILLAASVASLSLVACSEDKPPTVVHHTRTVHHYSSEQVNVPHNNNPDNFEAVEKPASYSR